MGTVHLFRYSFSVQLRSHFSSLLHTTCHESLMWRRPRRNSSKVSCAPNCRGVGFNIWIFGVNFGVLRLRVVKKTYQRTPFYVVTRTFFLVDIYHSPLITMMNSSISGMRKLNIIIIIVVKMEAEMMMKMKMKMKKMRLGHWIYVTTWLVNICCCWRCPSTVALESLYSLDSFLSWLRIISLQIKLLTSAFSAWESQVLTLIYLEEAGWDVEKIKKLQCWTRNDLKTDC